jgi:hypothetical protein
VIPDIQRGDVLNLIGEQGRVQATLIIRKRKDRTRRQLESIMNRMLICLIGLSMFTASSSYAVDGPWPAPNTAEAIAIQQGQQMGIGSVTLVGPNTVQVRSYHTWTLRYTVGPAGLAKGGSVLVGMRHMQHLACKPQVTDPEHPGYASLAGRHRDALKLDIPGRDVFPIGRFFPWQHIVRATVVDDALKPGSVIDIVLGDTSGGGPGMQVQPFDETHYGFKVYVDADGSDSYLPLASTPTVEIVAAPVHELQVVTPSNAVVGEPTWCIVRAVDAYGNPATDFRGTASLSNLSTHTYTESDAGVYRFNNIVFANEGTRTIKVNTDVFETQSNPILVTKTAPDRLLLWGDLHGHTLFSDGRGTVEEFYDFADRVAGLDFCAVTDHAYQVRDEMWSHTKNVTNAAYRPGHFVTLHAYEWSGLQPFGGDHNLFFLEDDPPIYRSTNMDDPRNFQTPSDVPKLENIELVYTEMLARAKDNNIFCIPHYGGRPANPDYHNPKVQRMIEVFSEHRRSEPWANQFLSQEYRLGIMASTDGHYGNPGHGYLYYKNQNENALSDMEIGMAAVAVYAPERTRESLFKSLYERRVYATSGDRIVVDFSMDGHPMGSEYASETPPTLTVNAEGTAPFTRVEFKKNGVTLRAISPGTQTLKNITWKDPIFKPNEPAHYYVRLLQENGEEAISSPVWVN